MLLLTPTHIYANSNGIGLRKYIRTIGFIYFTVDNDKIVVNII
jgi:hypothetical protein